MRAAEILCVERLAFLDPSFSSLSEEIPLRFPEGVTGSRILVDEREDLMAVAFHVPPVWYGTTFLYRRPDPDLLDRCEETELEIYQEGRAAWKEAVREYFSLALLQQVTPAMEDVAPDRPGKVESLLRSFWGRTVNGDCIDCCCGSGVGSAALRSMGMQPLSYDNDAALLARGLATGRLRPGETMWIDGIRAGEYLDPAPRGVAVMLGEINSFTTGMWEEIVGQFLDLAEEALITVGTREEVQRVQEWALARGAVVQVHENDRDPFYDHWVCEVRSRG